MEATDGKYYTLKIVISSKISLTSYFQNSIFKFEFKRFSYFISTSPERQVLLWAGLPHCRWQFLWAELLVDALREAIIVASHIVAATAQPFFQGTAGVQSLYSLCKGQHDRVKAINSGKRGSEEIIGWYIKTSYPCLWQWEEEILKKDTCFLR